MTGLHVVRKPLKLHDRYYVYAWRGGPCIHTQDDRAPVITPAILAKQQQALANRYGSVKENFDEVIIKGYENSPQFTHLAPSTKTEYKRWLNRISERFGRSPVGAFNDRRMRSDIIQWKNQWEDQPRTADAATVMMSTLLNWGVENAHLSVNVAAKIKKIHHVDRSDLIWEDDHWAKWRQADIPDRLEDAIFLASWTGLRLGDLVQLTWDEVGPNAIVRTTNKRKRRAVIPILAPLRAWMDKTPPEKRTGTVLKTSRGTSWNTKSLGHLFQRHRPDGLDRTIHDLRGTFCTKLILKGLTDDECAMIMGWKATRVADIRSRYVDEARVILQLAARLSA